MKKIAIVTLTVFLLTTTSSFALILQNGGFESGDFSGWDLDFGTVGPGQVITWGQSDPGSEYHEIITEDTAPPLHQAYDIDPYYEDYMAKINTGVGNFHATRLTQVGTIEQADIDNDANLYYTWGAAMVEPTNHAHAGGSDYPFFGVDITVTDSTGTVVKDVKSYRADATEADHAGSEWMLLSDGPEMWPWAEDPWGVYEYPGFLYYLQSEWEFDLGTFAAGDQIKIELIAADCGLGGHGGYAFIDGIGTVKQTKPEDPTPIVPEPATILLFGAGLAGLGGIRRKIRK